MQRAKVITIVAYHAVLVTFLVLTAGLWSLIRYTESLSHRRAYRRQRAFLGWTVGNHAVVLNSDG